MDYFSAAFCFPICNGIISYADRSKSCIQVQNVRRLVDEPKTGVSGKNVQISWKSQAIANWSKMRCHQNWWVIISMSHPTIKPLMDAHWFIFPFQPRPPPAFLQLCYSFVTAFLQLCGSFIAAFLHHCCSFVAALLQHSCIIVAALLQLCCSILAALLHHCCSILAASLW